MKRVAVVGASGYAGEELVRLLLGHPGVRLTGVTSRQYAGQTLAQLFPKFAQWPVARALRVVDSSPSVVAREADVVMLALPHGVAAEFARPLLESGCTVIDLSADFRLRSPAVYREFYGHDHPDPDWLTKAVYGLPELYREQIRSASLIGCPGCYPTSIIIPAAPLLRAGLVRPGSMIANSISGVSGAGRKAEADYLFCECHESIRAYGLPKHRHLSEIEQELALAAGEPLTVQFTPHLGPFNRGILTTLVFEPVQPPRTVDAAAATEAAVAAAYKSAYSDEPFVRRLEGKSLPDIKNVTGTNVIEMAWRADPRTGRLLIVSAEDNLIKGAGGQAVQCLNLVCGRPEIEGLL